MCARLVAEWRPRVAEGVEGPLVDSEHPLLRYYNDTIHSSEPSLVRRRCL